MILIEIHAINRNIKMFLSVFYDALKVRKYV